MTKSGWADGYRLYLNNGSPTKRTIFELEGESPESASVTSAGTLSASTWYHVVATWDGSTMRQYFNGSVDANTDSKTDPLQAAGKEFWIGHADHAIEKGWSYQINGVLDEVRISNTARTACWIGTSYSNQNSTEPGTHITLGAEGPAAPTAVKLISFTATQYSEGVLLKWKTGYEVSNLGFHVYREENRQLIRLTPEPVAGSAFLVPQGGVVLATDLLNKIVDLRRDPASGGAVMRVQAGAPLSDVQKAAAGERMWYPPDPTEAGCFAGGSIATNASGARSFRFGAKRRWVERILVALPDGALLDLPRGLVRASHGEFRIPLSGRVVPAPDWPLPETTKHGAGYFSAREMDLLTTPYVFNEDEAQAMVKAGADMIVAHVGLTTGGTTRAAAAKITARSYFSYGRVIHKTMSHTLFGRWHIDLKNAFILDYALEGAVEIARLTRQPMQANGAGFDRDGDQRDASVHRV